MLIIRRIVNIIVVIIFKFITWMLMTIYSLLCLYYLIIDKIEDRKLVRLIFIQLYEILVGGHNAMLLSRDFFG